MATPSSILTGIIPWTKEPGRLQSWGYKESDMTEQLNMQALRMLEVYEVAPSTALNVIHFPHTRLFLVNKSRNTHTHTHTIPFYSSVSSFPSIYPVKMKYWLYEEGILQTSY